MNEDHWDLGALHYQIYNSELGFDGTPASNPSTM